MFSFEFRSAAGAATVLVVLLYTASAAVGTHADEANAAVPMGVTQAHDLVGSNPDAVILDVRTPAEFNASHISGAMNLSVEDESFANLASELDPEKTYIVHCTVNPADGRSAKAIQAMQALGFPNIFSLEGGYVAWSEAKLPLVGNEQ